MKRQSVSYSFLLEMLWVCAFFLIGSAIFVLSFAKAEEMSRRADILNQAVLASSNALERTFAAGDTGDSEVEIPDSSAFTLQIDKQYHDGLLTVTVRAVDSGSGSVLYELKGVHSYTGAERTGT